MPKLRILHISDLHEETGPRREPARRVRVLGSAWQDHLDEIRGRGPLDLVCFTGDLAFSGQAGEYAQAGVFLEESLARLSVSPDRLFLVPGNHDIDRGPSGSPQGQALQALRNLLPRSQPIDVARWLRGAAAPPGLSDAQRDLVLERRNAYHDFIAGALGRAELLPQRSLHGKLGFCRPLPWAGPPVWVIGLDSAWMAGDDHDTGALWLTDGQVLSHTTDGHGRSLPGFRLVLVHHPLDHLFPPDLAHARRLLAERADLLLHGHLHETEPAQWADPERQLRQFAAGCLYEHDRYPNACTLIEVTLDAAGRPQAYDLWFSVFSARGGFWLADGSLYRLAKDGHLHIDC